MPDEMPQIGVVTPSPPWVCRVEATVWWHHSVPGAQELLPPPLRSGPPLAVGAVIRYLDSPAGPYDEVLGCPRLVRGALRAAVLAQVHVPFIAVDSAPSVRGGRAHWDLPKVLGTFVRDHGRTAASGEGWQVTATAEPRGPELPAWGRVGLVQLTADGRPRRAVTTARARVRLARVVVGQTEGVPWLLPGRHPGLVVTGRAVVGAGQVAPVGE